MRKLLLFLLLILMIFSFTSYVFGQAALTERWVCLKADKAKSGKGDPAFRQYLSVDPDDPSQRPIPLAETYIIECLATDGGQICTTGSPDLDMIVYKKNNVAEIQKKTEFVYIGLYKADGVTISPNPVLSDTTGDIGGLEWESRSGHTPRKFMAMNYWDPTNPQTGSVGGQQQGTFAFAQADKACVLIQWDPYGRVFDAQTLEPIVGAQVTLLFDKNGSYVPMTSSDLLSGNITNPQITKEDGQFSFVVPDGNYKLSVVPLPVSAVSSVHLNAKKAYDNLYPVQTGEIVVQKGMIQHRDIPVATANTVRKPKLMNYFYEAFPNGKLLIQGSVSHPLTKITAQTVKVYANNPLVRVPYRQIASTQTDKWGRFSLEIDQTKLEKTKDYIELFSTVTLIKTDLRLLAQAQNNTLISLFNTLIPGVLAQVGLGEATIAFEPIPQYLEGYIYDQNNTPIPNATIEITQDFSNKPYATVRTDKTGYIRITSEYLPKSKYSMRIVTPTGEIINIQPSEFVARNTKAIIDKKIDIYSYKDVNNKTFEEIQKNELQKKARITQTVQRQKETETAQENIPLTNPLLFITVSLLVLCIVLIIIIVILLLQRKKPMIQ